MTSPYFTINTPSFMIIHSVYFWLKPGLSDADVARFVDGAQRLLTIETVKGGYVGTPAATERRPIIDSSYSYSLIVICDDIAGHDVYQEHPVHDAFRELAHLWDRVQIYDTTTLA